MPPALAGGVSLAVIVSFTVLEIIGDIFVEQRFEIDRMWLLILMIGLIIYTIVRFLKKRTNILEIKEK